MGTMRAAVLLAAISTMGCDGTLRGGSIEPTTRYEYSADSDGNTSVIPATDGLIGTFPLVIASASSTIDVAAAASTTPGIDGVKLSYVRPTIYWQDVEPAAPVGGVHTFHWGDKSITRIDQYLARGINVFPVIKSGAGWATTASTTCTIPSTSASSTPDERTSCPPKDRAQYRKFLEALAGHFQEQNDLKSTDSSRGTVTLVAIEIEEHDPTFWGGTKLEYMDMLRDARAVFVPDPRRIQVTDGGVQNSAIFWLVVDDFLDTNRAPDALKLYQDYKGGKKPSCDSRCPTCEGTDEGALRCELRDARNVTSIAQAFDWVNDLLDKVDVMNFHNFGSETLLPAAADYLRRKQPGKAIVMNAVGVAHDTSLGDNDTAPHFMVRQLTVALSLNLDRIIWYSPPNGDNTNPAALIWKGGALATDNLKAFTTLTRFLNKPPVAPRFSVPPGDGIKRYSFVFHSHTTDVVWSIKSTPYTVPSGCETFDAAGDPIAAGAPLTLEHRNPYYVRCPRCGAAGLPAC